MTRPTDSDPSASASDSSGPDYETLAKQMMDEWQARWRSGWQPDAATEAKGEVPPPLAELQAQWQQIMQPITEAVIAPMMEMGKTFWQQAAAPAAAEVPETTVDRDERHDEFSAAVSESIVPAEPAAAEPIVVAEPAINPGTNPGLDLDVAIEPITQFAAQPYVGPAANLAADAEPAGESGPDVAFEPIPAPATAPAAAPGPGPDLRPTLADAAGLDDARLRQLESRIDGLSTRLFRLEAELGRLKRNAEAEQ